MPAGTARRAIRIWPSQKRACRARGSRRARSRRCARALRSDDRAVLAEADGLGGDDLLAFVEGLPSRPPGAVELDAVTAAAGELLERDAESSGEAWATLSVGCAQFLGELKLS